MIKLVNVCSNCGSDRLRWEPGRPQIRVNDLDVRLHCPECSWYGYVTLSLRPACRVCEVAPAEDETGLCGGCKRAKFPVLDRREEEDLGW
jgi:hypothetical protein